MLQIQRASAGSGKTYALAKKFIKLLLTTKEEGRPLRLKSEKEITAALPGIMAITFTNKATNEMKQRIVEKLSALSLASEPSLINEKFIAKTDYLADFAKELNTDYQKIGETAKHAISILLNKYSDFRISTIDAFFQEILRAFTYEANINDTYQVEIDTDYIGSAAIDSTLNDLDRKSRDAGNVTFWLHLIMSELNENNKKWNVFNKSGDRGSLYKEIRDSIKKLEDEDFKLIKPQLKAYFEEDGKKLITFYQDFRKQAEKERSEKLKEVKVLASELKKNIADKGLEKDIYKSVSDHLETIGNLKINEEFKRQFQSYLNNRDIFLKKSKYSDKEGINSLAVELYRKLNDWNLMESTPIWIRWKIYSPLLPYLGILIEVNRQMTSLLSTDNMIKLADTSFILKNIIGENDAPFIYERMGSRIRNYLIDEFQDTSRMQWDVLSPLITESEAFDNENLIIGDAKQSIYRFRNADSKLITKSVPNMFKNHKALRSLKEDNTNWRSKRNIVEFNNYFFKLLSEEITGLSKEGGEGFDYRALYENVVQYPHHRDKEGYVEIRFHGNKKDDNKEDEPDKDVTEMIGPLISDILERGYKMKDIAILVDKNYQGKKIVEALMNYNSSLEEDKKIEVISEDSLYISSAEAVKIIVNVLEKIGSYNIEDNTEKAIDSKKKEGKGKVEWNDIKSDYLYFSKQYPDIKTDEKIRRFIREPHEENVIGEMLNDMPALTLTAMVEAIVDKFLDEKLKKSQAIFISAFQDIVIDYSSRYSSDVGSFIEWWNRKGLNISITSPEGMNAVQIMTIHKSKGLEFKCVIIPYGESSMTPDPEKPEWRWVTPDKIIEGLEFPEKLPVKTNSQLCNTIHENIYKEYFDQILSDKLNAYYVAFTRAVDELYIFAKSPKKDANTLNCFLKSLCLKIKDNNEEKENLLSGELIEYDEEEEIFRIGELKRHEREKDRKEDAASNEEIIKEYFVNSERQLLHITQGDGTTAEQLADDEDEDPRSEGNLLHAVMSMIIEKKDLDRSFLFLKMKGYISRRQYKEWKPLLEKSLDKAEVKEWFDGSMRVINERAIIKKYSKNRRPDRIMISPDGGKAVVVDYKFGSSENDSKYRRQVADYMENLEKATGIKDIKGYLWYVKENKIIEVEKR